MSTAELFDWLKEITNELETRTRDSYIPPNSYIHKLQAYSQWDIICEHHGMSWRDCWNLFKPYGSLKIYEHIF